MTTLATHINGLRATVSARVSNLESGDTIVLDLMLRSEGVLSETVYFFRSRDAIVKLRDSITLALKKTKSQSRFVTDEVLLYPELIHDSE